MRTIQDTTHAMHGEYRIDYIIARSLLNKSDDQAHDHNGTYYIRVLPTFKPTTGMMSRESLQVDEINELTRTQAAIVRQMLDGTIFVRRFTEAKEAALLFTELKKGIDND